MSEWVSQFTQLQSVYLSRNQLSRLPESIGQLTQLQVLDLSENQLTQLPESIGQLTQLQALDLSENQLTKLPESLGRLALLTRLDISHNRLIDLPVSLIKLECFDEIKYDGNPLNPELRAAYKQGLEAVKTYLRAKAAAQITLNEAKLILVGEGEVGKSCLLGALRNDEWEEGRPTTHGIEIKPVQVTDPNSKKEITLNGWDFGGQRVYRPTHQLFFSAPAVYLVVWKPREGPQQGFVKEWIQLVKRREPTAKILVVATHGGPQQRQPDIDRQELWDLFGKDTVLNFFFVESKPDEKGERRGIEELKRAIARVASSLPEVGRSVPKSFQEAWQALQDTGAAYLPLERVLAICHEHKMDDELARLFVTISHRLGHLIHYEHDPALRDIVVLKPNWLSNAISFVLDDEQTRKGHGLVRFARLSQLWNDPARAEEFRYPPELHPVFLRLMERFDLSYRVAGLSPNGDSDPQSLIAQLVPDNRPENDLEREWTPSPATGDIQQVQICRIVDAQNGQSASAEGLFYQLIVRLHKYSLGRVRYNDSVHWQRGLVLDDDYNGRALLEHVGNDVRITVRAAFPERFLAMLTGEVKYLVESFWEGLRCDVMVPCINPCGKNEPGTGMFEVEKLITFRKQGMNVFPCMVSGCNKAQDIGLLLRNAPVATAVAAESLFVEFDEVKRGLAVIYQKLQAGQAEAIGRFDQLDTNDQQLLSRIDDSFAGLMRAFTDEAKEGPRLFSLIPVTRDSFDPWNWTTSRFRLTLWCEHSHLPLPILNQDKKIGVYEFDLTRQWVKEAAPFLKAFTITLRTLLPVAFSAAKLLTDAAIYKAVENELDFSKDCIDALIGGSEGIGQLFVEGTIGDEPIGLQR